MNIRKSVATLPREEFEKTLESPSDTRNTLYLVGTRFTDAVATHACMHLRVLRPQVRHVSGTPLSWSEYILDMDSRSVVIAFDVRRLRGGHHPLRPGPTHGTGDPCTPIEEVRCA